MNELAQPLYLIPYAEWSLRPRVLLGGPVCAAINQGSIVIDVTAKVIRGIPTVRHLSPAMYQFMMILLVNFGRYISYEDLAEGLWGEREDGGPEDAQGVINRYVFEGRRLLVGSGLDIGTWFGVGINIGLEGQVKRTKAGGYHPRKANRA